MASLEASQSPVEAEISAVKASCPGRCRVVKVVGDFSHVVTVQPADMDATIKFQMPAGYPQDRPVVVVRSESLRPETIFTVTQTIQAAARDQQAGGNLLQELIDMACKQLAAVGLRPGKTVKVNCDMDLCDAKNKTKKSKRRKQRADPTEGEDGDEKLPPMKTASEVVNRIIWDAALEKDDFTVGYFDRFRGIMERSFSDFSWEDLAILDYDVLAVPRHRIQYFKYKDVKVWDKSRRIDNVFGSAKGTKTIGVVVRELEERNLAEQVASSEKPKSPEEKPENSDASNSGEHDDYDEEDDDDDDGITVTIGSNAGIGVTAEKPECRAPEVAEEEDGAVGGFNPYWRDKLRPNYFICVRVTDTAIMEQICNVHDHLINQDPVLAECCIPGASLHVTLCTLGLDTAQQLQMCVDALNKVKADLQAALPTSPLHLHGVSHFYSRVIYAKVHYKKDFMAFCDLLKTLLREAGVQIRDGYEFVPHATIMKVTRPVARERGSKNIDPRVYAPFQDAEFGHQNVDTIYLCSMDTGRRSDGFYLTPLELPFKS